jgi:hypothetical protein
LESTRLPEGGENRRSIVRWWRRLLTGHARQAVGRPFQFQVEFTREGRLANRSSQRSEQGSPPSPMLRRTSARTGRAEVDGGGGSRIRNSAFLNLLMARDFWCATQPGGAAANQKHTSTESDTCKAPSAASRSRGTSATLVDRLVAGHHAREASSRAQHPSRPRRCAPTANAVCAASDLDSACARLRVKYLRDGQWEARCDV